MNNQITVGLACAADMPAIQSIIERTAMLDPAMIPPMIAPWLAQVEIEALWLVARVDEIPIGVIYARAEPVTNRCWNLLMMAIDPDYQGRSVGRRMMAELESRLTREAIRLLIVETSGTPAFEQAQGFYASCGFTAEARVTDFYDSGDDKIIFRDLYT
jgi:GNAT superfamily N-acetyltransferase